MSKSSQNRRSLLGPLPGDYPLGSWESRAAVRFALAAREQQTQEQQAALLESMTPLERAFLEGTGNRLKPSPMLRMLCEALTRKGEIFGWPPITPEYIRHERRVSEEVSRIERERVARGDTSFLNHEALRKLAEDRLRRECRDSPQTGSTTAEPSTKVTTSPEEDDHDEEEDEEDMEEEVLES